MFKILDNRKYFIIFVLIVFTAGMGSGYLFFGEDTGTHKTHTGDEEAKSQVWTCSMHPQVRKDKPGKCPICFMDLIPLSKDSGGINPEQIKLSDYARKLAEIQTAKVYQGPATKTLRLPGTLQLDETRVKHLTAWVGGRIERLYVNYTGIPVKKGEHMAEFYSPELIAAREELLKTRNRPELQKAVVQRLLRWGISSEQIESFKNKDSSEKNFQINSPSQGVVIEQSVKEGMYVNQGTRLFSIADMTRLWLMAKVYERDVQWLKYGQKVQCEFEAYPGQLFSGTIAFISPVLETDSRTVDARINIDNSRGRLKPGMFGRVTIKVATGKDGEVINPDLAGKWISPMHPEVIKDGPGKCDVCGMDLVPVKSMGINTAPPENYPLIIPESALIWTGPRSLVYKKVKDNDRLYEAVEVIAGSKVDGGYIIKSGLSSEDEVVVNGAFKLDAEQQINGRKSMMSPDRDLSPPSESAKTLKSLSPEELKVVEKQIKLSLAISKELAEDNLAQAKQSAKQAHDHLMKTNKLQIEKLTDKNKKLMPILMNLAASDNLKTAREHLFSLTPILKEFIALVEKQISFAIYEEHCPMAFDNKGANWLQAESKLANPYYGAMMLRCGETRKIWGKDTSE
jgi:Cu(I)/Ag(I) efflux system membrane fusion protein